MSPSPEVFFKMLRLPSGGKPWKMKKISRDDFERAVGDIDASVSWLNGLPNYGDDQCRPSLLISVVGLGPIRYTPNHQRADHCQVDTGDERVLLERHVRDRDLEWKKLCREKNFEQNFYS